MYVDDTVIMERLERELVEKINVFRSECRIMSLEGNQTKGKVMVVGKESKDKKQVAEFNMKKEKLFGCLE